MLVCLLTANHPFAGNLEMCACKGNLCNSSRSTMILFSPVVFILSRLLLWGSDCAILLAGKLCHFFRCFLLFTTLPATEHEHTELSSLERKYEAVELRDIAGWSFVRWFQICVPYLLWTSQDKNVVRFIYESQRVSLSSVGRRAVVAQWTERWQGKMMVWFVVWFPANSGFSYLLKGMRHDQPRLCAKSQWKGGQKEVSLVLFRVNSQLQKGNVFARTLTR